MIFILVLSSLKLKKAIKFKGSKLPKILKEYSHAPVLNITSRIIITVFRVVSFICTLLCLHTHFVSCICVSLLVTLIIID